MTPEPVASAVPRVLLAEESLPFRRVIREALMAFRICEVDDAPNGERAFEMALKREYSLFLFSLPLPDMTGDMLDRLLSKAYPLVHAGVHTAPPVIFLMRPPMPCAFRRCSATCVCVAACRCHPSSMCCCP
jgi:CheY-like chemotaxis protein